MLATLFNAQSIFSIFANEFLQKLFILINFETLNLVHTGDLQQLF